MGFQLDQTDVFEGGIKDGKYEIVVNRANEDATQGGTEYAELDLIIRNDLEQQHKNQHIFHKVWKAKATGKYNMRMFNTMGKACQLQNGKQYNSMDELLQDFVGKAAVVTVKNEESEYNGQTYQNLNVKQWEQTKFPNVQHQYKQGESNNTAQTSGGPIEVNDSDLPF